MSFLTSLESPQLFHFNATCEMAVGNGTPSYTAPAFLRQFERELELIPLYLAGSDDYLLLENLPSEQFLQRISVLKPNQPKLFKREQLLEALNIGLPLNGLNPWGWSPAEHRLLEKFKSFCSEKYFKQKSSKWNPKQKELYGRKMALNLLNYFIENTNNTELFISQNNLPQICQSNDDVEFCMKKWQNVVVKAPWSSSGRGMIVLCRGDFHDTYKKWVNGVLKSQGYVMVEPMLDKVCDLSFHFEVNESSSVRFLGQASFSTTDGGQYVGNNVQPFPLKLPTKIYEFLNNDNILIIQQGLQKALEQSDIFKYYSGVLGIDALLYKDEFGQLKFQPCLEINLRQNMGTVALAIRSLLPANSIGMWQVKYFTEKGSGLALEFDRQMRKQYPLVVKNGKMIKGYLPLIEPYENRKFALFLVVD